MPRVTFELTGEDSDLVAALQRTQREMAKLQEAAARVAKESKDAARESKQQAKDAKDSIDAWTDGIQNAVAGYFSMQGAINLVSDALERKNRIEDAAAQRQVTLAQAQREYLSNLGGTRAERDAAIKQLEQTAKEEGIPLPQAYMSAGKALGFTQGGVGSEANAAFRVAARFNPYDTEDMTFGLLAAAGLSGTADPMANLGLITSAQDYSPIANTGLFARNVVPGAKNVKLIGGGTDVEALALINAISNIAVDPEGREAAGTAQRLARAAKMVAPELTTDQAIERAWQDRAFGQRIADKIENSVTKAGAEALLFDSQSEASENYRASKRGIAPRADRVAKAEQKIEFVTEPTLQQTSELDRSLGSRVEELEVQNTRGGRASIVRRRLDELSEKLGESVFTSMTDRLFGGAISMTAGSDAANEYRAEAMRQEALRRGRDDIADILVATLEEIRAMRAEQLDKQSASQAFRQNAANDLNTHTEGR